MTVLQMLNETATYTDTTNELGTTTPYTGAALTLANKFVSGLNYAKNKICRERYAPDYRQSVTLDSDLRFQPADLTYTLLYVYKVLNSDGDEITCKQFDYNNYECPYEESGATVTVYYKYLPSDFSSSSLTTEPSFAEKHVDHKLLCYYAAYQYLLLEGDTISLGKSSYWLNLWNDGFNTVLTDTSVQVDEYW